ncbi:ImmA/IrrE family metallo-endopeptidase [Rhodococcus qingshengii]|uniref:ImmA/IrrE family metallo-endopeptidase n=1 Tax=Rhodococcus qingshengii TaxID=334542 RepID=UPI0036D85832
MVESALPQTPTERIALLVEQSSDEDRAEISRLLGVPLTTPLETALRSSQGISLSDIVSISEIIGVPSSALTGQAPLDRNFAVSLRLGIAERTGAPVESLEFIELILRRINLLDSWLGESTNALRDVPLRRSGYFKGDGETSALRIRDAIGVVDEPLHDLVGLVESCAIPVYFRDLPNDVHGLNVRDERDGITSRVIVVSTRDPWTRQRFTLAHELCHGLYDDDGQVIVDQINVPETLPELRAEVFARHLLLPTRALKREFKIASRRNLKLPQFVAHIMTSYGISKKATINALASDGLASADQVAHLDQYPVPNLMKDAGLSETWFDMSEGESEGSASPWLVDRALNAYSHGFVGIQVVADVLEEDLETTRDLLTADS